MRWLSCIFIYACFPVHSQTIALSGTKFNDPDSVVFRLLKSTAAIEMKGEGWKKTRYCADQLVLIKLEVFEQSLYKAVVWLYSDAHFIYSDMEWIDMRGITKEREKIYFENDNLVKWTRNGADVGKNDSLYTSLNVSLHNYSTKLLGE